MLRVRLAALAAVAALVVTALVLTGGSDGDEPDRAELVQAGSIDLVGKGFGHGRGMSQWGAQGAAVEHGHGHRRILNFYYRGTTTGTAPAQGAIRVLITGEQRTQVLVEHRSHLRAVSMQTGDQWPLSHPGAERWRVRPLARDGGVTSRIAVRVDGRWRLFRDVRGPVGFRAGGRPMKLWVGSGWRAYRGALQLRGPASNRAVVNLVRVETYLRGVVPREVPASWHPAALRAQAVAARTYAYYERNHPRGAFFDVYDTVASQVYGGAQDEHPATDRAVRDTNREIRVYEGRPAFTQYSASNGGWTVQGSVPYQTAKRDRWDPWIGNPHRRWRVTLSAASIERAFPSIGTFRRVRIDDDWRDGNGLWGGRVLQIRIVGSEGGVTVTGTEFRSRLGLRSNWFIVAD